MYQITNPRPSSPIGVGETLKRRRQQNSEANDEDFKQKRRVQKQNGRVQNQRLNQRVHELNEEIKGTLLEKYPEAREVEHSIKQSVSSSSYKRNNKRKACAKKRRENEGPR